MANQTEALNTKLAGYRIRDLSVAPGLVLAPMSGVTCSAFRRLIRRLNPGAVGLVLTEFVSVEALTRKAPRSLAMIKFRPEERPLGIQIFGYDIKRMADGAKIAQDAGPELVDINCGCPAPKVVRKGGGCELMRQPDHLVKMLREVRRSVKIPLTLKMRSGWDDGCLNAKEIAKIAEGEGIEGLAIHGRTRTQLYRGTADWSIVEEVSNEVAIPVLGSGDIVDTISAEERIKGKIAGLFIGRGAISNPLVFSSIFHGTKFNLRQDLGLILKILADYVELLREDYSERISLGKMKQLVSQMCAGYSWKKELLRANSYGEQHAILSHLIENNRMEGNLNIEPNSATAI